jgi:HD-like signal output (HDOD) protein/ActR/RegA family two-component response regulator
MTENKATPKGNILCVDDERSILDALAREFMFTDLTVFKAQNANEGLAVLSKEKIDIVLTDFRMPGEDGMQFLKRVKTDYPDVARIIFSGFLDKNILMRSLTNGWASTFLTKPWNKDALSGKIGRILAIKAGLKDPAIFRVLNQMYEIPTLPSIYKRLTTTIGTGNTISAEIVEAIRMDPILSAKLLQVANSAFFGEREIISVKEATDLLDASCIRDIVLTARSSSELKLDPVIMTHLLEIYVESAIIIKYIPRLYAARFGKRKAKYFPSCGIVRGMGKIIMLLHCTSEYGNTVSYMAGHPGKTFGECEDALGIISSSHIYIAHGLLELWNFPRLLLDAADSDNPDASEDARSLAWAETCTEKLVNRLRKREKPQIEDFAPYKIDELTGEHPNAIIKAIVEDIPIYTSMLEKNPFAERDESAQEIKGGAN